MKEFKLLVKTTDAQKDINDAIRFLRSLGFEVKIIKEETDERKADDE